MERGSNISGITFIPQATYRTWSISLPPFSYNKQCNNLDQTWHLWSKTPPSFSYNNQCIDLDHPHIAPSHLMSHLVQIVTFISL